ncbi:excalibur calcium-binding domain-containing protein [Streptomyces solicathayae]|uniref:Excalibur calcium-binding domain-containing protein n=1 Tax=Streptomyces solicathayae TaxID=3081768 RepID=A0ABZ0LZD5_9ACTN|nr:excalibur calcium-binding domain-containing protein [Streptomyces sp. HUAS YS2]WOX24149.1 excalibur calcium-binding domain-containing protein [Streptomyces sp. HUAS YS2]
MTLTLVDDQQRADGGEELEIAILANDTATEGDGGGVRPLADVLGAGEYQLEIFKTPANGTAVVSGTVVTYTPTAGFSGADEFVYQVTPTDTRIAGGTAVVRIAVPAPSPSPTPKPTKAPAPAVYYRNCDAARAAGVAPLHRGDKGYGRHLDRDGDGVACEPYHGSTGGSGGSGGSSSGGGGGGVYYANCAAARAAGAAPVRRGDPGYGRHLDRDGDGVACE